MTYDVFISYSRRDFDEVNTFMKSLHKQIPTLTFWFDITGIESGDEFEENIINAINNSSYILFFLSENSIKSQWTKDEVMYAKNMGKKIIPILLKDAKLNDGWFLFKFGRIDCINSMDSIQVHKLIENLSNWVNKEWIKVCIENGENSLFFSGKTDNSIINYKKWNWGAFSFGLIWAMVYRIYWPLFFIVPYLLLKGVGEITSLSIWLIPNIILAIKGNEWAYKRQTLNYKEFENGQKSWTVFSFIFLSLVLLLITILIIGEYEIRTGNSLGLNRISTWSLRIRLSLF